MGRFDALTQLEEKPKKTIPSQKVASPTPLDNNSGQENLKSVEDTLPPSKPTKAVMKDVLIDVVTSWVHNVNLRGWRDTIENTETHHSSLRMTTDEGDDIEDLITELKRKLKVKTSLNEVARLGLLYLLYDFKKNRENSIIYKVKKS